MILGVTPDDVYQLVSTRTSRTQSLVITACCLIGLQIVVKIIIFWKVLASMHRTEELYSKVLRVLSLAEKHGEVTDRQTARTACFMEQTSEAVKKATSKGPDVTAAAASAATAVACENKELLGEIKSDVHQIKDKVLGESTIIINGSGNGNGGYEHQPPPAPPGQESTH